MVCPSLSLAGGEFPSSGVTGNGGNVGTRPGNQVPGNVGEGWRLPVSIVCFLLDSEDEGPRGAGPGRDLHITESITANPRQCQVTATARVRHTLKLHRASGKRM